MKTSTANARKRRSEQSCTDETEPSSSTATAKKPKRLTNSDVSDFMVKNNIRKESELMQIALQRSANGEKDLQGFILNKNSQGSCRLDLHHLANARSCTNRCARKNLENRNYSKSSKGRMCFKLQRGMVPMCKRSPPKQQHQHLLLCVCVTSLFYKRPTKKCQHPHSRPNKLRQIVSA